MECQTKEKLNSALKMLKRSGLKLTHARKMVLHYLSSEHGPFSADQIHHSIDGEQVNITTIYRILSKFEDLGMVHRSELGDGTSRFELFCQAHPHHHLVCKRCKRIEIIPTESLSEIGQIALSKGFNPTSLMLEVFGVCKDCTVH